MEFVKGYMDNAVYRHLLNDMTGEIFVFSFEEWYTAGFFEGEYIPYSCIENGKIIANASANIMKFLYNGEEKFYIQIGTVMTRPEYRNRGLARMLIGKILGEYEKQADGFYLYGNLNAVGFYARLGFHRLDQYRWSSDNPAKRNLNKTHFIKAGEDRREEYRRVLKNAVCNAEFDHINRCSLQLFYTMGMEDVYYNKELDCFAVMRFSDQVLYLDSVVSTQNLKLGDVLERIQEAYSRIVLGFTPMEKDKFHGQVYDGDDEYRFFYLGKQLECVQRDKLYFPVMSHA